MTIEEALKQAIINRSKGKVREHIINSFDSQEKRMGYLNMLLENNYIDNAQYGELIKYIEVQ